MMQRTVNYRARSTARVEPSCSESAFPLTFLALAFGMVAGVALAGIVIPVVVHSVLGVVLRAVTGA